MLSNVTCAEGGPDHESLSPDQGSNLASCSTARWVLGAGQRPGCSVCQVGFRIVSWFTFPGGGQSRHPKPAPPSSLPVEPPWAATPLKAINLLSGDTEGHQQALSPASLPGSATAGLSPGSGGGKEGLPALTTGEGGSIFCTAQKTQCRAKETLGALAVDLKPQQCSLSQEEMLAISQAAQGSPAAPVRDGAGNSVLQSN